MRIADECSGGCHKVLIPFLELLLSLLRSSDDIGGYNRDVYSLLYRLCQMLAPARLISRRLEPAVVSVVVCAGYVNGINAELFKPSGDLLSGFEAIAFARFAYPFHHLINSETHHKRIVFSAALLDPFDYFLKESHSVLKTAAVFVLPMVGIRRQKLLDQISVSSVEFNDVDSRPFAPLRSIDEILLQLMDLPFAHGVHARRPMRSQRLIRRRLHREADPFLFHVKQHRRALIHQIHELRHTLSYGYHCRKRVYRTRKALPAGVMQLDRQLRSMAMELSDHLTHRFYVVIMAHCKLCICSSSRHVVDSADTRYDKANSPFSPFLIVIRESRCNLTARFA